MVVGCCCLWQYATLIEIVSRDFPRKETASAEKLFSVKTHKEQQIASVPSQKMDHRHCQRRHNHFLKAKFKNCMTGLRSITTFPWMTFSRELLLRWWTDDRGLGGGSWDCDEGWPWRWQLSQFLFSRRWGLGSDEHDYSEALLSCDIQEEERPNGWPIITIFLVVHKLLASSDRGSWDKNN